MATGAIAGLVDEIGYSVLHVEGVPISVSVNMSISYLSNAKAGVSEPLVPQLSLKWIPSLCTNADSATRFVLPCHDLQDELEITSKIIGQRGAYSGTTVLLRKKAGGETVAEGRHSLFSPHASKL